MAQPDWVDPMLATLVDAAPQEGGWVYERKLDGIRALAFRDRRGVRLLSRNRLPMSYPDVESALAAQPRQFVADGEIVAYSNGRTSFELLQQRGRRRVQIRYYLFDLLFLDGEDLRALPLEERKRALAALEIAPPLMLSRHRRGDGASLLAQACARDWEGLIAKRADARYRSGRSRDWLKLKCVREQELVVGGFSDPKGSRVGFGALLVGYYDGGALRYAGEVGTGFTNATLRDLTRELRAREQDQPPFADPPRRRTGLHWVRPDLIAQVAFTEWTRDGKLRHPRFLGLRTDKAARDVVRERPA